MQRLQAFKFELCPNGEQDRLMRRFAGACRFVFNKALALQTRARREPRPSGNPPERLCEKKLMRSAAEILRL
jgi:hypothetical protein